MSDSALDRIRADPSTRAVAGQFAELPADYFDRFPTARVLAHAAAAADAEPLHLLREPSDRDVALTVITRDVVGLFSYIAGLLGAEGFNIAHGQIYRGANGLTIDTFGGTIPTEPDPWDWLDRTGALLAQTLADLWTPQADHDVIRERVAERVGSAIRRRALKASRLMPMELRIRRDDRRIYVRVESTDTPFFLYSLGTALHLHAFSIESLKIDTRDDHIRDELVLRTVRGASPTALDEQRLRMAVLVTKQFSHALAAAPDPRLAFTRFEDLVQRVAETDEPGHLPELLSQPAIQRDLARLLGASDFLWEDFIRLQYENLVPMLDASQRTRLLSTPSDELGPVLRGQLVDAVSWDEQLRVLNQFKDYQSYLIDTDHILRRNTDFFFLSHRLTRLAELVVATAFELAWKRLTDRYGKPTTAGGSVAQYAVCGLGKMGGNALGYASDIELMTIYSDSGRSDGATQIDNREFFERLVETACGAIASRREAIFEIDLRLRPYGDDGPKAVHIESFIAYYEPGGRAHSIERLALIRMRPFAGSQVFGERVVAIRDQLVYTHGAIGPAEIGEARAKQAAERSGDQPNAKFSPGALVDIEYNVQLLQARYGADNPALRDPGVHATLRALSDAGAIGDREADAMIAAYRFMRNVINGLRMLRGNAQDLFLPPKASTEFAHLARRTGYRDDDGGSASDRLWLDFETHTATVRSFVERHLGESALVESGTRNPADLVLAGVVEPDAGLALLEGAGFRNPDRGVINLRRIAGEERQMFARLAVLAWDDLRRTSDPDMALNNWERFTDQVSDRAAFFIQLLQQPRRLDIMLRIFAGSQFLADTLIRRPNLLVWLSDVADSNSSPSEAAVQRELDREIAADGDELAYLSTLRRFRRREMLRIGTQDICLNQRFDGVVSELSVLARAIVNAAVAHRTGGTSTPPIGLAVLALGKLGGSELNYSSDIDLLAVVPRREDEAAAAKIFMRVVRDLTDFSEDGQVYRVDLRLRPYGDAGALVYSRDTLVEYYRREAEIWELQALLKAGPIAGDLSFGAQVLQELRSITADRLASVDREQIKSTVRQLRARGVAEHRTVNRIDVKNGVGGIRDVEFLLQAYQLIEYRRYPEIVTGTTLSGVSRLAEVGIMPQPAADALARDYVFLRRIEHFLQVYDDQQLHALPADASARGKLARRLQLNEFQLDQQVMSCMERVRRRYTSVVGE